MPFWIISGRSIEHRKKTIFRGKEQLWQHTKNWKFLKISYSQPKSELVRLMTSGIYQFWKYWLRDRQYLESKLREESRDSPDPLSLRYNISFIFVILIIGILMASSIFLAEHAYYVLTLKYGSHQYFRLGWRNLQIIQSLKIEIVRLASLFRIMNLNV